MRRNSSTGSSLELLLDTITNVFGGVVFIAILVALLTTARTSSVNTPVEQNKPDPAKQRRVQELRAEKRRYRRALEELGRSQDLLDSKRNVAAARLRDVLARRQAKVDDRIKARKRWLERYHELKAEKASRTQERVEKLRDRARDLRERLEHLRNRQSVEARLHKERRTEKHELLFLLANNAVYPVPLGLAKRTFQRAELGGKVNIQTMIFNSWAVKPHPGQGLQVDGRFGQHPGYRRLMQEVSPRTHFFELYVRPDSVKAYMKLRQAVAKDGFEYAVYPQEEKPLILSAGGSNVVQ